MTSRYQRLEKIAPGGRSHLWKAQDSETGRTVILKQAAIPAAEDDLQHEIHILQQLRHPHIVQYLDTTSLEGQTTLVIEYLPGETLETLVQKHPLSLPEFTALARHSLSAIAELHQHAWLHHDLQPQNLIRHGSDWKIIDFGSARPLADAAQTALVGHVCCLSPERLRQAAVDERSDLYALGCLFYYALSGKFPFAGETSAQIITAHLRQRPQPLHEKCPHLPSALCQKIDTLIANDPSTRPACARLILDQFDA